MTRTGDFLDRGAGSPPGWWRAGPGDEETLPMLFGQRRLKSCVAAKPLVVKPAVALT
jgi:hypothetical protein